MAQAIDNLEVVERGVSAEVEEIFAESSVASAVALSVLNGGEVMLDMDAASEVARPSGVFARWRSWTRKGILRMQGDAATTLWGARVHWLRTGSALDGELEVLGIGARQYMAKANPFE